MGTTTSLDELAGASVGGREVPLSELLHLAKVKDGRGALAAGLEVLVVQTEAAERGITADDTALQEAADELRRSLGLTTRQAALDWLDATGRSAVDFDVLAEHLALRSALAEVVIDDEAVKAGDPDDLAVIARLVTRTPAEIDQLGVQLSDEGADFFALADEHSILPAPDGNRQQIVRRSELTDETAGAVFGASRGAIVGPFDYPDCSELIRVDTALPAARDAIFDRWLQARVDAVDLPGLAQL